MTFCLIINRCFIEDWDHLWLKMIKWINPQEDRQAAPWETVVSSKASIFPSVQGFPETVNDWITVAGFLMKSIQFSSGHLSCSVVSDSLPPHESQHARPPCSSPTPGVHSDSHPSREWCHPAISSSVVPFSSCPQSLPASESFPMSWPKWEGNPKKSGCIYIYIYIYMHKWFILLYSRK